jgi:predicted phage replisome organizer
MSDNKKYYYLKLKDSFFSSEEMKILAAQKNGSEYQLLYTKLMLLSVKSEGRLEFRHGVPYDAEMLSSILDVDIDTIKAGIELFAKLHLVEMLETGVIFMSDIQNMIGKSSTEAERKLEYRKRIEKEYSRKNKIPFIENYTNKKRYGGNYYIVFDRDKKQCIICGSKDNLMVHHVYGYIPEKPENNDANKLVTLCQICHGKAHSKDEEIIELIMGHLSGQIKLLSQKCPPEIELDTEKEKEKDIKSRFAPPQLPDIILYMGTLEGYEYNDATSMFDYYTANGWMVGRSKMKDWKAACRTWMRNKNKWNKNKKEDKSNRQTAIAGNNVSDHARRLQEKMDRESEGFIVPEDF